MKVMWVINVPTPEASATFGISVNHYGGWLDYSSRLLAENGIDLIIAFPYSMNKKTEKLSARNINYIMFTNKVREQYLVLESIIKKENPDLIHIHGTEVSHSLVMVQLAKELNKKFIVSIQGLVSVIAIHMQANLPVDVLKGCTLRNFLNQDNVMGLKKKFEKRGLNEKKVIENSNHIVGRTTLDKAVVYQINPKSNYHFCNEILRENFYRNKWDYNTVERFSLFVSQASYSIKGLHHVIQALPIVLKKYPKVHLYVGGPNLLSSDLVSKLKKTYYTKYIQKLIKDLDLKNNVTFTGFLDEQGMIDRYLKSHVFISPSSIENSSNSLSEAMLLGVPVISSYVGGIPDMMTHGEDGYFYQEDAYYMLAYYIEKIFDMKQEITTISYSARTRARLRNDPIKNTNELIEIYRKVFD